MLLEKNVGGQDFYDLLDFCFARSDSFSLTYIKDMNINHRFKVFGSMLEPHCFKSIDTYFNEVTIGPEIRVFFYYCNKTSIDILKLAACNLFDLTQPSLLEDIAFYKEEKAWFKLNSHEKYFLIEPYSEELTEEIDKLNALYFD